MQNPQSIAARGICVIIPTYNNAGTIADVVTRALKECRDVIVVCDGCTDGTVSILESLDPKPVILDLKENGGKGKALKAGFRYALGHGFAYAVTLDGDGQHFPEDIPVLVEAGRKHPGALIVGERSDLDSMQRSAGSRFANRLSNFWFAVQTLHILKDTQTGYRLYPLNKLRGLSLLTSRYEAELELLVFAAWHGVKLVSAPVRVYYPEPEDRVSHFRPGRDFARISLLTTVLCLLSLVYALPLAIFRVVWAALKTLLPLLFFIVASVFVATPFALVYMNIGKKTEKKKETIHRMIRKICSFTLYKVGLPGVEYSMSNPHGETFGKPAVIICNHQSHLDLLPMLSLTDKLVILTADWVWNDPFYGYIIRQADFLPASSGIDAIMPRLRALAEKGYSIAVCPEGTRSRDCSIGRFHQGAFKIARELSLDILPAVLYGSGHALPKHGRYLRSWPMTLELDRRISPQEMSRHGETLKERASYMRDYYRQRYAEIADRMEQNV
ncbi:MAG: glycosyltransferase [Bacteroidales bacterium]|nr:glycosyltransferase [Bacteroidales bacterium]